MGDKLEPVSLPVDVDDFPLASLDMDLHELEAILGRGLRRDPEPFGDPGPIYIWAFRSPAGQLVAAVFLVGLDIVNIHAEPKDADAAIGALGLPKERVSWRSGAE